MNTSEEMKSKTATGCLRFGVMSDIHLVRKPYRFVSALRLLRDVDILLLAGDLTNSGSAEQYAVMEDALKDYPPDIPIFAVSGNHDLRQNDNTHFLAFERKMWERAKGRYPIDDDPSGAYSVRLNDKVDLFGLNPLYDQKIFRFPDRARQFNYLWEQLDVSPCPNHILLCHPPLAAHGPQPARPYLPKEQETLLQGIVDAHPRTLFLSGHTHLCPAVEHDALGNLYVNDGSLCPTQMKETGEKTYPGNVVLFEVTDSISDPRVKMLRGAEKEAAETQSRNQVNMG